jgi:hypothetical protein
MRYLFLSTVLLFVSACSESQPANNKADTDSTGSRQNVSLDTSVYSMMIHVATEVKLPALIQSDTIAQLPGLKIDSQSGYDLLPGDFDPASYKSVYCVGRSVISKDLNALWFCLRSSGELPEASEVVDILMVLYDSSGRPLDVCNVASSSVGYSYSYVRTDSLFTVEVNALEKINVSTYGVAIGRSGFIPEEATTTVFPSTQDGIQKSELFRNSFIDAHRQ